MGMDLVALNPKVGSESFHVNWTGWSMLGDLLTELGADVSEMSGSNDGDEISEETSKAWADAISENWDRIVCVRYADSSYVECERVELHVVGTQTPVLVATSVAAREWARSAFPAGAHREDPVDDSVPTTLPLSECVEEAEWLARARDFFANCGGACQY